MKTQYQDLEKEAKSNTKWDDIINNAWKKHGVRDINDFVQHLKDYYHPSKRKKL